MANVCLTCKWWKKHPFEKKKYLGVCILADKYGLSAKPAFPQSLAYVEGTSGWLTTHASFGCVQHNQDLSPAGPLTLADLFEDVSS